MFLIHYQLHLLIDEIATELEEFIDLITERLTTLGGYAELIYFRRVAAN
jgi:DNA-binding ferritin-like protein